MELANSIEAILFYQAEPMSVKRLAGLLKRSEGEIRDALGSLAGRLASTGLRLIQNGDEVTLGTSPDASSLIESITKEELSKELSKASLETLAIVLYKGPITRAEIDYIRGVNSTFILRNLLVRGLVEKVENPNDQRSFLYKPTFQLLEYMGATDTESLPEYSETLATLTAFANEKEKEESTEAKEIARTNDEIPSEDENRAANVLSDIENEATMSSIEADVAEIDEAGKNYDDAELEEHREEDEQGI